MSDERVTLGLWTPIDRLFKMSDDIYPLYIVKRVDFNEMQRHVL